MSTTNSKRIIDMPHVTVEQVLRLRERAIMIEAEMLKMSRLVAKHGICLDCEQLIEHDNRGPFAHCGCGTTIECGDDDITPHMKRQLASENLHNVAASSADLLEHTIDSALYVSNDESFRFHEEQIDAIRMRLHSAKSTINHLKQAAEHHGGIDKWT